jgi:hypothetical protein
MLFPFDRKQIGPSAFKFPPRGGTNTSVLASSSPKYNGIGRYGARVPIASVRPVSTSTVDIPCVILAAVSQAFPLYGASADRLDPLFHCTTFDS